MKIASLTDIGIRREMNQDYFFASEEPVGVLPNLFIVADGMGGHLAGEFASRCAVETIVDVAQTTRKYRPEDVLSECISTANDVLWQHTTEHLDTRGMGTTIVAAVVDGDVVVTANVGDSRLYVVGEDIRQITADHSLVQEMVRMGEMDADRAKRHPDRNFITRAVGAESTVLVDVFETPIRPGELLLLCTDGLTNMIEDTELCSIMTGRGSLSAKTEQMINLANKNGGRDNITVILIDPEFER